MPSLRELATNPQQYDSLSINWEAEGAGLQAPTRKYFWHYLKPYSKSWKGKSILEIGCGSGWLLDQAEKAGAGSTTGVEPSKQNCMLAEKYFPGLNMVNSGFEDFHTIEKFDIIAAVAVFGHIDDLSATFKKISAMLNKSGEVILTTPDFDYFAVPHHGHQKEMEAVDEEEYITLVTRPMGPIADIARSTHKMIAAARLAGLHLIEEVPMPPTEELMTELPKYRSSEGQPMWRLLRFQKV